MKEDVVIQGVSDGKALVLFIERPLVRGRGCRLIEWAWLPLYELTHYRVRSWTKEA